MTSSDQKVRVLFVCLGNICRSPLAEGIFKKMLKQRGLHSRVEVESAGTSDFHIGEQPDKRTIANALQNGIKLEHRGRQIALRDFTDFQYIVVMDKKNQRDVEALAAQISGTKAEIVLMRKFEDQENRDSLEVPDPYFGDESGFQRVYSILYRSSLNLIDFLDQRYALSS